MDAQNRPTSDSALTDRMLVTKLFGEVMPMIRYEMTDTLILDDAPNPDVPGCRRIRGIKGRSDSWFVYEGGIRIHPMIFRDVLGQEPHISEYQVRQTPEGAQISLSSLMDRSIHPCWPRQSNKPSRQWVCPRPPSPSRS